MTTMLHQTISVAEYATRLGRAVRAVGPATIEGEVQRPKASAGGMLWFSLTDGEATLSCKVFRGQVRSLEHTPRHGDLVRVEVERPDLWARSGKLDVIVGQVRLAGEGELLRAREELLERLRREGLCDPARRRPLPAFPRAVGVIAGRDSDGLSDVVRALVDRWPAVHVITSPCTVQGKAAPGRLIDALVGLADHGLVDAVVMARGGGSVHDLAPFDDERLCRALFASPVPVVCAIGHTDNDPVCNHVTWAAYTPSRSAELVVPSAAEVRAGVAAAGERISRVPARIESAAGHAAMAAARGVCERALALRAGLVREAGQRAAGSVSSALTADSRAVGVAGQGISATPYRATRQLATVGQSVGEACEAVAGAEDDLAARARAVRERGAAVRTGARRQLDDHSRDYGRALSRLVRETGTGARRRGERSRELVDREHAAIAERVRRGWGDAERGAREAAALVAARDFRQCGWVLASHADGRPVRSAGELRPGEAIGLDLHDGGARAIVSDADPEPGGEPA